MSSLQPIPTGQPLPTVDSSTVPLVGDRPFNRDKPLGRDTEPVLRVADQLDRLTATLDVAISPGLAATVPSPSSLLSANAPAQPASGPPRALPEDESLDSYLQKHMQRLMGKTSVETPAVTAVAPAVTPDQRPPAATVVLRQPTPAPELRSQLTAMRDVAMDSARRAVQESSQIQRILAMRRAYRQAKLAALATTVSALALLGTHAPLALTGSLLMYAVAVILSVRFVLLFRTATAPEA